MGNNWKHQRPKIQSQTTHPPHPHPSPGTPYQQSGTTGGPIRPLKQQYIPPKQSIFPERPQLLVTTGSVYLKSKVKPTTLSPSLTRDPISTLWDHGGPHQTPKQQMVVGIWILGQRFQLLPMIEGAQDKWIVLKVCIVIWGV